MPLGDEDGAELDKLVLTADGHEAEEEGRVMEEVPLEAYQRVRAASFAEGDDEGVEADTMTTKEIRR